MERKGIEELKKKYVEDVFHYHDEHNRGKNWGVKAIKVLFSLSKKSQPNEFIPARDFKLSGIPYGWKRSLSSGIVEKAEDRPAYRIRKEFYQAVKDILDSGAYSNL